MTTDDEQKRGTSYNVSASVKLVWLGTVKDVRTDVTEADEVKFPKLR